MISEFASLGSCSSRNIFYSKLNENYKSYFKINKSIEFVNMVSMMSNPTEFNEKLLRPDTGHNKDYIREDFNKKYLDFLKEDDIVEYIIIDTFYDVEFNNLVIGKNQYLTDSTRLRELDLYNSVKDYDTIGIKNDFDNYFELCKKSYDRFFKFIYKNRPSIKIILNCSRSAYKYLKDGEIVECPGFKNRSKDNKFRNILDSYILKNYDIDILPFDDSTLIDINHIFGPHPTHYETRYYVEKTYQLNEIINRNSTLGLDNELNQNIRQLRRNNQIQKMEIINCNFENDEEIKELNKRLNRLSKKNDYLESELDAMLNSNSWKMTEPLRNLKRKL